MPWLDNPDDKDSFYFSHVPRAGGTSVSYHHRVYSKAAAERRGLWKFGMHFMGHHYYAFEKRSWPCINVWDHVVYSAMIVFATIMLLVVEVPVYPYFQFGFSCTALFFTAFIFTPPIGNRITLLRRLMQVVTGHLVLHIMENRRWICGVGNFNFLMHMSVRQVLDEGFMSKEDMRTRSFATVRSPFSRMVSLYTFNRRPWPQLRPGNWFGGETFDEYVRSFHAEHMDKYVGKGIIHNYDMYCHLMPMHEFTHRGGVQMVPNIVKLEQVREIPRFALFLLPSLCLPYLLTQVAAQMSQVGEREDLPDGVKRYLTELPRRNARTKKKDHWSSYYSNPETVALVLEMFRQDFDIFGYSTSLPALQQQQGAPAPEATSSLAREGDVELGRTASSHGRCVATFALSSIPDIEDDAVDDDFRAGADDTDDTDDDNEGGARSSTPSSRILALI